MTHEQFKISDTDGTLLDICDFLKNRAQVRQRADFRHEVGRDHRRDEEAPRCRASGDFVFLAAREI